jgi:hypothetical protein
VGADRLRLEVKCAPELVAGVRRIAPELQALASRRGIGRWEITAEWRYW